MDRNEYLLETEGDKKWDTLFRGDSPRTKYEGKWVGSEEPNRFSSLYYLKSSTLEEPPETILRKFPHKDSDSPVSKESDSWESIKLAATVVVAVVIVGSWLWDKFSGNSESSSRELCCKEHDKEEATMWTKENWARDNRDQLRYSSDVTEEEWAVLASQLPPARRPEADGQCEV